MANRLVDQAGRAYTIDGKARSAVEALDVFRAKKVGPVDRPMANADLVSSYAALCPSPDAVPSQGGAGGGGGSSHDATTPTSGNASTPRTISASSTTPTTTTSSRTPAAVVPNGGGSNPGSGTGTGTGPGPGKGGGSNPGHTIGVPFPIAGAGLPFVLAAGGFVLARRRRASKRG